MVYFRTLSLDPPLYATNYPLRMFVSVRAIVVAATTLFEPASINHELLIAGEPQVAIWTMTALLILGACGIVDAFINDILPTRFLIRWLAEHRHLLFLALAAINIGFGFIVVSRGYRGPALAAYAVDAAASIWIAIYHVRHRYVVPRARARLWAGTSGS